jgi:mRNA interferase MazF
VADRIAAVVVAPCTRTIRGLTSELPLGPEDGLPEPCVASFDNVRTLQRAQFRRRIGRLSEAKMFEACQVLMRAVGCST